MRLKYDSKKPRRIEIVVFQDDVLDVPTHVGEPLTRIAGFVPTKQKVVPTPLEQLEAFADAVAAAEGDARDELVNALIATTATLTAVEFFVGVSDETVDLFDPSEHKVDEVIAYVTEHPDQRETVLATEQAGKDRKTLVEALTPADG